MLQAGNSYLLILRKFPKKPEYWLPAYFKNFYKAGDKRIGAVERIADPSKWPWGKAADGLQIALLPSETEFVANPTRKVNGRPASVHLHLSLAARNTSKQTIRLNVHLADRAISVRAVDEKGAKVEADLYGGTSRNPAPKFGPASVVEIAPGDIAFIAPGGKGDWGFSVPIHLVAGKWKIEAVYQSNRAAKDVKLWKGKAASGAADITVRAP